MHSFTWGLTSHPRRSRPEIEAHPQSVRQCAVALVPVRPTSTSRRSLPDIEEYPQFSRRSPCNLLSDCCCGQGWHGPTSLCTTHASAPCTSAARSRTSSRGSSLPTSNAAATSSAEWPKPSSLLPKLQAIASFNASLRRSKRSDPSGVFLRQSSILTRQVSE